MIKFKKFMSENNPYGMRSALELIFRRYVPLTPKMFNRLFGSNKRSGYHVSGFANLRKLKKLEGSKKSVSCFTKIEEYDLNSGVVGGSGITTKLTGEALIHAYTDAFTMVDKQGRRWVSSSDNLFRSVQIDKIYSSLLHGLVKKYLSHNFPSGVITPQDTVNMVNETDLKNQFKNKKDIQKFIKEYIDESEKNLKKSFKKFKRNVLMGYGNNSTDDFDEIVLSDFKIDKVLIDGNRVSQGIMDTDGEFPEMSDVEDWLIAQKISYKVCQNAKAVHKEII